MLNKAYVSESLV